MSQNKVKVTWKAIVAIILVMATLISMSALVSAGFVEEFLGEEYGVMATMTSSTQAHSHTSSCYGYREVPCEFSYFSNGASYCTAGYSPCSGGGGHTANSWGLICHQG